MTHKEKAERLIRQQYHCTQAIVGAFADNIGLDLKTALKISTCFGGGMRRGEVCGCLTGAVMVLGMVYGYYDAQDKEREVRGTTKTEELVQRFSERMEGKLACKEILGLDLSRPEELAVIHEKNLMGKICPGVLSACIEILEELLPADLKSASAEEEEELDNIAGSSEMRTILISQNRFRRFKRSVGELLLSSQKEIAFIQFDIRQFKVVNDLYGEKIGDEILQFVREQLKAICDDRQYFIHLRSDVFMLVTEYDEEAELTDLIERLNTRVGSYKDIKLQMTYGVYTVEDREMELRQMEDRAAMARKAAKQSEAGRILFYKEQFKENLYNRKFIEENMQAAIAERQFMMYLQPKYSIAKNEIIGAEALVRWRHPERGMIFPDQFIPVLEDNGFIRKVDYFIWGEACRFIKRCETDGIPACPISVNVSRVHLRDDECIKVLSDLIQKTAIPRSMLELEITESVDDQEVSRKAYQLKDEGYTLLMDDFGSGYSSLNILLETPFDVIKLDKRFMESMMVSGKGKLILEQVVAMANKLGLGLLAEGVETREQVDLLQRIGCDQVQGYYYAKPMPEEDFYRLLREQRAAQIG